MTARVAAGWALIIDVLFANDSALVMKMGRILRTNDDNNLFQRDHRAAFNHTRTLKPSAP